MSKLFDFLSGREETSREIGSELVELGKRKWFQKLLH